MNMKNWLKDTIKAKNKKAMPILSFPGIKLKNFTVKDIVTNSDKQAECIISVAKKLDTAACVAPMDLSIEAECFGCNVIITENEVPNISGNLIENIEQAQNLKVPDINSGRIRVYVETIKKLKKEIKDRPVFAGIIGSFSLAGRLVDVSEAMIYCFEDPDMMHIILEKCTDFLIEYAMEYKKAGADGIILSEPLAGLLSPDLAAEFSEKYVRKIVDSVQDDNFIVIYHNCGNTVIQIISSILATGSAAYHFGNAINMCDILPLIPENTIAMGNIDPVMFKNSSKEDIKKETENILKCCSKYSNFVISSGCDIPPEAKWENIDMFFDTIDKFYNK